MTNKQIAERIEAAGHPVPAGLNRAKLEALAAEKGVNLEEGTSNIERPTSNDEGEGTESAERAGGTALPAAESVEPTGEPHSESADHDGPTRLITPQMACAVFPGAGEAKEPEAKEE